MERVARIFRNNRSQAVRIPKEFELPSDEVTIAQQADGSLVIRPRRRLVDLVRTLEPLGPEDALDEIPKLDIGDVVL